METKITIKQIAELIGRRWDDETAKRKLVMTDHGYGYLSVGFDKTLEELIKENENKNEAVHS